MTRDWYKKGLGVSKKGAEYVAAVVPYLISTDAYPSLKDLGRLLQMRTSSVCRLEGVLKRQGVLSGSRQAEGLKVATHILLKPPGAQVLVRLRKCIDAGLVDRNLEADEFRALLTLPGGPLGLTVPEEEVEVLLSQAVGKGYLKSQLGRLFFDEDRWAKEALLLLKLSEQAIDVSHVPKGFLSHDDRPIGLLPRLRLAEEGKPATYVHTGPSREQRQLLLDITIRAVLQSRGEGKWALRVRTEWPGGPSHYKVRILIPNREPLTGVPDEGGLVYFENIDDAMAGALRHGARIETVVL